MRITRFTGTVKRVDSLPVNSMVIDFSNSSEITSSSNSIFPLAFLPGFTFLGREILNIPTGISISFMSSFSSVVLVIVNSSFFLGFSPYWEISNLYGLKTTG